MGAGDAIDLLAVAHHHQRGRLDWAADEGVSTRRMRVQGQKSLPQLARRLDEMARRELGAQQ